MNAFSDLLPSLLKTLEEKNLTTPTEIQSKIIPLMLKGESVVGIAETGSGKTLAYALPIMNAAKKREMEGDHVTEAGSPLAIIMVPTRDLGEQIAKVFKVFTHETRLRVRSALGGTTLEQSRTSISGQFEILLGTPGRITQLLNTKALNLSEVMMLVFDEADQMMDEGFLPDSERIAEACPDEIQLAMFSATESVQVQKMMETLFAKANVIRSTGSGRTVESLVTKNLRVLEGKRWPVLEKLLETREKTILFVNTRDQADALMKLLTDNGFEAGLYRGDMDKVVRRKTIQAFRDGKIELLISTELGARGLDIEDVTRIVNYHMPKDVQNYIHRAGRTARAGREGTVYNLITERDQRTMEKVRALGEEGLGGATFTNRPDEKSAEAPKKKLTRKEKDKRRSERRETPERGAAGKAERSAAEAAARPVKVSASARLARSSSKPEERSRSTSTGRASRPSGSGGPSRPSSKPARR